MQNGGKVSSRMGILGTHPAVFARMANEGDRSEARCNVGTFERWRNVAPSPRSAEHAGEAVPPLCFCKRLMGVGLGGGGRQKD